MVAQPAVASPAWVGREQQEQPSVEINQIDVLVQPKLGQVMTIEEECFPPCERLGPHLMQQQATLRTSGLLLAEIGATLGGYLLFSRHGGTGLVTKLAVASPFRRRGIGSALLRRGIEELEKPTRKSFLHEITLHVDPSRPEARALYERHGFRQVDFLPNYYSDSRDALLMRRLVERPVAVAAEGSRS